VPGASCELKSFATFLLAADGLGGNHTSLHFKAASRRASAIFTSVPYHAAISGSGISKSSEYWKPHSTRRAKMVRSMIKNRPQPLSTASRCLKPTAPLYLPLHKVRR